jgi:hypothetical protein
MKNKKKARLPLSWLLTGRIPEKDIFTAWDTGKARKYAYTVAALGVLATLILPAALAEWEVDAFGNGLHTLYADITKNVMETNSILSSAFSFTRISPYDLLSMMVGDDIFQNIRNAVLTMALVVATLLIMADFFKKTINFEWSSKWENILLFLVKIIVIKQVVQNADVIVSYIYAGFDSINQVIDIIDPILPEGDVVTYVITEASLSNYFDDMGWQSWVIPGWGTIKTFQRLLDGSWAEAWTDKFEYLISHEAVGMFYGGLDFPNNPTSEGGRLVYDLDTGNLPFPKGRVGMNSTLELVLLQPFFLVMKAIALIIFVIAIGRVFELALYTIFAPLPLATFASDVSSDVGKGFIKTYIACVIQVAVIAVMYIVFVALIEFFNESANGFNGVPLLRFIALIALGMSVMKSGAWARKLCGTS